MVMWYTDFQPRAHSFGSEMHIGTRSIFNQASLYYNSHEQYKFVLSMRFLLQHIAATQ